MEDSVSEQRQATVIYRSQSNIIEDRTQNEIRAPFSNSTQLIRVIYRY